MSQMYEKVNLKEKDLESLNNVPNGDEGHTLTEDEQFMVDSVVPRTDDPNTPSLTFRVMFLGTMWNVFLATANSIFMFRTQPFGIPSSVATLLSYPMAILMAKILPTRVFNTFGFKWSFNPGGFSIKEHVLIYIIASAGAGIAYGVDNVIVQKFKQFMGNDEINYFNSLLFVLGVQLVGFGLAGILRRFLVKPASMYWPSVLGQLSLFIGFHERLAEDPNSKYKMTRFTYFWIGLILMFVYTWIPDYFFTSLQGIAVLCLLSTSKAVRLLGSPYTAGVGIGTLTFDWQYLGGGLMIAPFWATLQGTIAAVFWLYIVLPIMYYSNAFGGDQMIGTLNTNSLFDFNGTRMNPLAVLDHTTYDLNVTAYNAHKPIYITTFFALNYGLSFLTATAALMHVFLWHGKAIWTQLKAAMKQSGDEEKDIHNQLMKAYPDIPEWLYLAFLAVMVFMVCMVSVFTPFKMPVWAAIFSVFLTSLFLLPFGVIYAITGIPLAMNVITEFVIGLMIPGQTIAVMAFKSLGTNTMTQAMNLIGDLKLGHYMKINPVHMVFAQFYGTVLGAILNTCVSIYSEKLLSNLLMVNGNWHVTSYNIFYQAGAIWGAIGPTRFFGIGAVYQNLLWFFFIGAVLPVLPWIGNKVYPHMYWRYINIPVLVMAGSSGYFQNSVIMGLIIAWFFQVYIFNNHREWWAKYNYILAMALDTGVSLALLVITLVEAGGMELPPAPGRPTSFDHYCFDLPYDS